MEDMTVTARMDGVDLKAAYRLVAKRHFSLWHRHGIGIICGVFLIFLVSLIVAHRLGHRMPGWVFYVLGAVFFAGIIALGRANQRRVWTALKPGGEDRHRFTLGEEGLRVSCDAGHSFTHWHAFSEVIDTPVGLLLLTGPLQPVVIPASAFATPAEREALRSRAADLIARAR